MYYLGLRVDVYLYVESLDSKDSKNSEGGKMGNIKLDELKEQICLVKSKTEIRAIISKLKILSSNMRSNNEVINLINEFILKARYVSDEESIVVLQGLLILQLEHSMRNLTKIEYLIKEMQDLAYGINYKEGIAFSHSFSWYIEKYQGNTEKSRDELNKAVRILKEVNHPDEFIFHFINYSYALEEWLKNRNPKAIEILEVLE